MWDSSHTYTHHTINQIGVSQSPPLKSLTPSLGPTLWGSVSEPTQDYQAGSDTICNDLRKSASHIYAIPQKDQSQLKLLVVVNKVQIYLVNTRCGTHHTHTHTHHTINQIGVSHMQSIFTTLWTIWFHRNMVVHEGKQPNPMEVILIAQTLSCRYKKVFSSQPSPLIRSSEPSNEPSNVTRQ